MKKTLLLLMALLATVGMTMAQDVWTTGYRNNTSTGKKEAVLHKNGVFKGVVSTSNTDFEGVDVATKKNGTSYYTVKGSNTSLFSYIYECETYGQPVLNTGSNALIHDLFSYNNYIYGAGYHTVNGNQVACFWNINATDPRVLGSTSGYDSEAFCGLVRPASSGVICAGYQKDANGYHGVIWRYYGSSSVVHNFETGTKIFGMTYYNGYYYTVGTAVVDGQTKLRVWKTDETDGSTTLVYTILESTTPEPRYQICIFGGDCYVSGKESGSYDKVWKNGEPLYSTGGWFFNMTTNGDGIYYVGRESSVGKVWKDGTVLYTIDNTEYIKGVDVAAPVCADESIRPLPFFDGFEEGETDWNCWTKIDVDNSNGNYASYWDLGGKFTQISSFTPHTGDHYAKHHRNTANAQEGWLVSPRLFLQPGRDETTLKFYSRNGGSHVEGYGSVWISTSSDPTNTSAFTQIYAETSSTGWTQRTVSLKDYQGQAVYIAFKYVGTPEKSLPAYYIDDVEVTESWSPCGVNLSYPWTNDFENLNTTHPEPGYCWYILDNDHTGNMKCWQWDESNKCAKHPYGPNDGISQEGWLFSQPLHLESGKNYTLTFLTKTVGVSYYSTEGSTVWIAQDETGNPDPSHYTKIWTETNPSNSWRTETIDLTSYAGQTINIAFKYQGIYAHDWLLDDIVVTEALPQYTVAVEANNAAWGTVTGGNTYNQGDNCTIAATPATGYEFKKWVKDGADVSTEASYTFTVDATTAGTYTAVFGEPAVVYYTVNTEANPAEGGTVEGGATVAAGQSVTLTAIPNEGYDFTDWNDGNTENPRTVVVTGDITYTANFTVKNYTLTVVASPAEGGTVTGGNTYPFGQMVEISATPNEGWVFLNWNDGVTLGTRTVRVIEDATYTALFADTTTTTYTITAIAFDATMGSVQGGGIYPEGTVVTLTAVPFGINVFSKWNDNNTENPRTITVTEDKTFIAVFETPELYTITVTSENEEMGTVTGGGDFPMGTEILIEAVPYGGYYFKEWNDGNTDNPRTIVVNGAASYQAKFVSSQVQTYTLTVTCNPSQGYVEGTGNYPEGTSVTIKATPWDGYAFDHWNDGNTHSQRTVTVTDNVTYVAFFKSNVGPTINYTITVNSDNTSMGTVSGGGTFEMGSMIEIKATPKAGYEFERWNDNNTENPRNIHVVADATYTAYFKATIAPVTKYTITVVSMDETMGTVTGGGEYAEGATATIAAVPYEGYIFTGWDDGTTENPRTFTVTEDKTFEAYFRSNAVNEFGENMLNLYPNPAKESIRIEGLENETEMRVYNSLGKMVKVMTVNADQEINVSDLAPGIYMIRCGRQTLRFVKE